MRCDQWGVQAPPEWEQSMSFISAKELLAAEGEQLTCRRARGRAHTHIHVHKQRGQWRRQIAFLAIEGQGLRASHTSV